MDRCLHIHCSILKIPSFPISNISFFLTYPRYFHMLSIVIFIFPFIFGYAQHHPPHAPFFFVNYSHKYIYTIRIIATQGRYNPGLFLFSYRVLCNAHLPLPPPPHSATCRIWSKFSPVPPQPLLLIIFQLIRRSKASRLVRYSQSWVRVGIRRAAETGVALIV